MKRQPTEMELRVALAMCSEGVMAMPHQRKYWIGRARAAIRAMRQPTAEMLHRGRVVLCEDKSGNAHQAEDPYRGERWRQMIDAASPTEDA